MTKREKTMNLKKHLKKGAYSIWVNKKSGTIHHVSADVDYKGKPKLFNSTLNLRYERNYFFSGDAVDKFLKNYDYVCTEPTDDFWVNVLANEKLKSDLYWGLKTKGRLGITKDEFFGKVFQSN
jgi:hypothetical protein